MFFEGIWLMIGFLFCSLGIFGGAILLLGKLDEKYKLPWIFGFIALIISSILCVWTFKFLFIPPYFSF